MRAWEEVAVFGYMKGVQKVHEKNTNYEKMMHQLNIDTKIPLFFIPF